MDELQYYIDNNPQLLFELLQVAKSKFGESDYEEEEEEGEWWREPHKPHKPQKSPKGGKTKTQMKSGSGSRSACQPPVYDPVFGFRKRTFIKNNLSYDPVTPNITIEKLRIEGPCKSRKTVGGFIVPSSVCMQY